MKPDEHISPCEGTPGGPAGMHLDADLCLDLMHGLVSGAREAALLEHVAGCPACEALLCDGVRNRERLRGMIPGKMHAREVRGARVARWRYLFAGAAAAGIAVVLLLLFTPEHDAGSVARLPAFTQEMHLRGAAEERAAADLARGIRAYEEADYAQAIAILEAAKAEGEWETVRRVYLGSALAWVGRHRDAAAILRSVSLCDQPEPWSSVGIWTLYASFRKCGMHSAADSLVRVVAIEPGADGERARRILSGEERR